MPRYRYAGPGPVPDPEGELVHPGDVREYAEEPAWGPWELLDGPDTPAPDAEAEAPALSGDVSVPLMTARVSQAVVNPKGK